MKTKDPYSALPYVVSINNKLTVETMAETKYEAIEKAYRKYGNIHPDRSKYSAKKKSYKTELPR